MVLGAVAILNILFGRIIPALTCAFVAMMKLDPSAFFLAGPVVCLLTSGSSGIRIASLLGAFLSGIILMKTTSPEAIAGVALSGASLGLSFWMVRGWDRKWVGLAGFAITTGVAVYFHQNWFLELGGFASPEQFAGLTAFLLTLVAGNWLTRRLLPLRVRTPKIKIKTTWGWRPKIRFAAPNFSMFERVAASNQFVVFCLFAAAAALVWAVELFL
jgi:hypothetical protein